MRKPWTLVGVLLSVPLVLGVALPAAAAPPNLGVAPVPSVPSTLPNSDITGTGHSRVFDPSSLTATWSSATESECTTTLERATLTNMSSSTAIITYKRVDEVKIKPGGEAGLCFYGTGTATFTLGLRGSKAKLAIHVS